MVAEAGDEHKACHAFPVTEIVLGQDKEPVDAHLDQLGKVFRLELLRAAKVRAIEVEHLVELTGRGAGRGDLLERFDGPTGQRQRSDQARESLLLLL
jgi:hypothetical protein